MLVNNGVNRLCTLCLFVAALCTAERVKIRRVRSVAQVRMITEADTLDQGDVVTRYSSRTKRWAQSKVVDWTDGYYLGSDLSDRALIRSITTVKLEEEEGEAPKFEKTKEWFIDQYIDHSNPTLGTFKQRFLMNYKHYKLGGPILLFVTSGTPVIPEMLHVGSVNELAEKVNGMSIALEQRYYGSSYPVSDLTTENMRYLTLNQSVNDIGYFIKTLNREEEDFDKAKWIIIGGSYGGNLAGWARSRFPDLIYSGWISSAPMKASINFYTYDRMVGRSLASTNNTSCQQSVTKAIDELDRVIATNQSLTQELQTQFRCDNLTAVEFRWGVAEVLGYLAQYSSPSRPPEIMDICQDVAGKEGMDLILGMSQFYRSFFAGSRMKCQVLGGSKELLSTAKDPNSIVRQNFYIICNEMGHFQSVDSKSNHHFRSKWLNVEILFNHFCRIPFNLQRLPDVARTNQIFNQDAKFSRTVFTTGDLDPWFPLTKNNETWGTSDTPIYIIKNGRHDSDFNLPEENGVVDKDLDWVRNRVFAHIQYWLSLKN